MGLGGLVADIRCGSLLRRRQGGKQVQGQCRSGGRGHFWIADDCFGPASHS